MADSCGYPVVATLIYIHVLGKGKKKKKKKGFVPKCPYVSP
jgi:hypothetical protein